ncbi:MAG: hypothetical protein ACOYX5_04705 [Actinomycetota bacterium]
MNKKLMKASIAGAAALALAAGGSTFANWTDFKINTGNQAGAGKLVLNVSEGAMTSESMTLAPGENQSIDYYIASNDGLSVPDGKLYITLKNLRDEEDGCTSFSEAVIEGSNPYGAGYNPATGCGDSTPGNDNGELSQQARMEIWQYGPSASGVCGLPAGNSQVKNFSIVSTLENQKYPVADLEPGEATCVRAIIKLEEDPNPVAADDRVQGDRMTWDFLFDLEQL